jgi:transcriptional regulator with XRE-family HTH domain
MALYGRKVVSPVSRREIELGERLARLRLSRNITQGELAGNAGIHTRTLKRLEAGEGVSLDTFIRVLTALRIEDNLDLLVPNPGIRPIERVHLKGHERQRARASGQDQPEEPWQWGDEGVTDD